MSSFDDTERIIAFPASTVGAMLSQLRAAKGAHLRDGNKQILTIIGHKDREGSDEIRAGQFGTSVIPTTLTDGRLAVKGYWSRAALAHMQEEKGKSNPAFARIEELTQEQFKALLPTNEQPP